MIPLSRKIAVVTLILLGFNHPATALSKPVSVFVTILPQKYLVQQIGKELVEVQVLVPPGASPHIYEPKPGQMRAISKADLYFALGVPFEKRWLERISAASSKMRVVPTDQGIEKLPMLHHAHEAEVDDHHDEGGHEAGDSGLDPHIWLSPTLVRLQAGVILAALQETRPARAAVFRTHFDHFISRLGALDTRLRQTFSGKSGLAFMVYHPSWGYFASDYGIRQIPIELEGKNPKPAQLQALIQQARQMGIKVIFVQPQFSTKSAELIARAIGGQVVFADPLAEDWMANLNTVADGFRAALK